MLNVNKIMVALFFTTCKEHFHNCPTNLNSSIIIVYLFSVGFLSLRS